MSGAVGIALAVGVVALLAAALGRAVVRRRVRRRLLEEVPGAPAGPTPAATPDVGGLAHWLAIAGFQDPSAPGRFVAATVGGLVVGAGGAVLVHGSGLLAWMSRVLTDLPGGYGALFVPLVFAAPWLVLVLCGLLPYLHVNRRRRERVRLVERDLPLTLELLATLGQAGLGFDAAIARILDAQDPTRPLFEELARYQRDLLAGVPRIGALRRLARRLEIGAVSMLCSALVQAEQMGSSLAETLRRQAAEVRARRRAEVLIRAESLTVKLVFPLVICFMPGLFVFTLGPAFHQLFQLTDSITRGPR